MQLGELNSLIGLGEPQKQMSLEQKIAEKQDELAKRDEKGQFKKLTWRKRFGFFRIMWIFGWGVAMGAAYMFVWINYPDAFAPKTIHIINQVAEARTEEAVEVKIDAPRVVSVEGLSDTIWSNESSRGVNNYSKCDVVGKVNQIGYAIPGDGTYRCFESHDDEMKVLAGWIVDHRAQGMTDKELLCHYSANNYNICK